MINGGHQPLFRLVFSVVIKTICLISIGIMISPRGSVSAQTMTKTVRTSDSLRFVQIIQAKHMRQFTIDDSTQLQTLAGQAKIKEAATDLEGDSMVINKRLGTITIFGHVHLRDGQGMDTYADYLLYNGTSRTTYLKGNVRIINGNVQLYGSDMEYNMLTGIGKYRNGGKVINGSSVLTSREADYYSSTKDVLFRGNVHLRAPRYDMQADSLRYNTQSRIAQFIAPTRIKSESGTIQTNAGYYDMQTGEAVFIGYTTIQDDNRFIRGNRISFDDKNNRILVEGNGKFQDTENKIIVLGNQIDIDKKNETFLATRKPVMIFYDDNDSTYITADTLLSAKRPTTADDTISKPPEERSRMPDQLTMFKGYHHVKIYNDSVQAICDSLFYNDLDSTFGLFGSPFAWNQQTQLSGDTIYIRTQNNNPREVRVIDRAFLINQTKANLFHPMSGSTMHGTFINGLIDRVITKGSPAESVFYPQDEDSLYMGLSRGKGEAIDILFKDKTVYKVSYQMQVSGALFPLNQIPAGEDRLRHFIWNESKRPRSKSDIFK